MILRGSPADDTSLNYLRDCLGLLAYLLDQGGLAIYDPLTIHWWDPETWRQQLSPVSYDGARHHTVILASEEPDDDSLTWFHTRGMRKFGRPDISIQRVPAVWREGAIDLCQRLIEYQALGHVLSDGEEIRMASLPAGTVVQLAGHLDDPDFNNVHLEVVLPETD